MDDAKEKNMTFWDHLEELRKVIFRIAFVCQCFSQFSPLSTRKFFSILSLLPSAPILLLTGRCAS